MSAAEAERHARYRKGLCTQCGAAPYSAGRTRCASCHASRPAELPTQQPEPARPVESNTTFLQRIDDRSADTGESLGGHAVAYARAGLPVLPLHPRRKTPASRHGKDDATTDLACIRAWWAQRPDSNIGVRPPTGMVVVDVDPRNGGDQALDKLCAGRELPRTWTARTGSGGRHIWLRHRGPLRGKLCAGVDLKSHSGYLVMPPSVHPDGGAYAWEITAPIAWAPAWLHQHLAPPVQTYTGRMPAAGDSGDKLVEFVARAQPENRNHALYWAACRAAEEGVLPALTNQLIAAAISTGLPETEARGTVNSAAKRSKSA